MAVRDWSSKGTSYTDSPNREAPNKHIKGSKAYKKMIAEDTARIDREGKMPFQFIKPPRKTQQRRDIMAVCLNCTHVSMVNTNTCGVVCSHCKKYTSIGDDNKFTTEEDLNEYLDKLSSDD